ncbi:hypothetical protein [Marichromatium purpuratum]|nr:hypothetical protein [Marichromatium purpuratum]
MTEDLHRWVSCEAADQDRPVSVYVRRLIERERELSTVSMDAARDIDRDAARRGGMERDA